jgi:hypothetical protein
VLVHAVEAVPAPLTMRGWNCDVGEALQFSGPQDAPSVPRSAPMSIGSSHGTSTVTVAAMAPGDDSVMYVLFTPGRWDVEVWQGARLVGNIVFLLPRG